MYTSQFPKETNVYFLSDLIKLWKYEKIKFQFGT